MRVQHPAKVMVRAQELRAADYGITAVQRILAGEGHHVSYNTVRCWTEPEFRTRMLDQKNRAARAKRAAASSFQRLGQVGPEWLLARMRVLSGAGVSAAAIARVMAIDFPDLPNLTPRQVWDALNEGRLPLSWRRALKTRSAA